MVTLRNTKVPLYALIPAVCDGAVVALCYHSCPKSDNTAVLIQNQVDPIRR